MGLVYIPGRNEERIEGASFPKSMTALLKAAVDTVWAGSVAIEEVPEVKAYVVQLQGARRAAALVGLSTFIDNLCEAVDHELESHRKVNA
jgi:hypothetical protein